jgi:hypothetical protein
MEKIICRERQRLQAGSRALQALRHQAKSDCEMAAWLLANGLGVSPDTSPFVLAQVLNTTA